MSGTRAFHTLDVFTDRRFAGNPLAVVLDADDLTAEAMQIIAREFNLSETIFVQRPDDPAHDAKVRIFFPTAEIPFAGHPTIGCAIYLAEEANPDGDFETVVTLEEVAGLVPVMVRRAGGAIRAEFTAPVLPFAPEGAAAPSADAAARAVGLDAGEIGFDGHRPGVFEGGPSFVYIPVADRNALARAQPQEPHWSAMLEPVGADSAYLYARGGDGADTDYRARMFSPNAGIPEDPATGSATAILAAQLLAAGELTEGTTALRLEQGYEMGRPSDLDLEIDVTDGAIAAVRVGGSAVRVSQGRIALP